MGGYKVILVVFIIFLLFLSPVNAGFWDWVFKSSPKSSGKSISKQIEKKEVNQAEKSVIEQAEKKEIKTEGKNQAQINKESGDLLDNAFKESWCMKNKCVTNIDELKKTGKYRDTVYIVNDFEANRYIQQNLLKGYNRRPDMLEVNFMNDKIKSIKIYDTKTSANALSMSMGRGQSDDYNQLCLLLEMRNSIGCEVRYVLPKDEANQVAKKNGGNVLTCLAIGLVMVPDPTDLLCFVAP